MGKRRKWNLKGLLINYIRRAYRFSPFRREALENAQSGKAVKKYKCNSCSKKYTREGVKVDHISPVVDPKVGWVDWNTFIDRMFCPAEKLQILCDPCHDKKTKTENKERRKTKKNEAK